MRRYVIFIVAGVSLLTVSVSSTMVSVAFPQMISFFNTSLVAAGWVLSVASLTNTVAMPLAGKACDIFGRKFIFILCTILFTVGSILCALAPNIGLLIFFRVIQGVGAGGFLPSATAIIAEEFPEKRLKYIGLFSTIFPIGQILGPNLGGWLTEVFGWRSTFWVCIPFGVLVLIMAVVLLRKTPSTSRAKLDLVGAGLISGMITIVMLGISLLGNNLGQFPWWKFLLCFVIAAILLVVFILRLNKVENPIIDVQVLRERPFAASNIFNFLYGVGTLGVYGFIPLYAVSIFNMSTLDSGLILTPRSIAMVISSFFVSMNLVRWGYRWPMVLGTAIMVAALVGLAFDKPGASIFGWSFNATTVLIILLFFSGFSQGIVAPASNNACIELAPDKVGVITGVRGMFRQLGSAISTNLTAVVIHNSGDLARGFFLVFIGLAVITLLTIPIIMFMPKGSNPTFAERRA
jgi:EmrB/QacA subfamily drug resistance transporter